MSQKSFIVFCAGSSFPGSVMFPFIELQREHSLRIQPVLRPLICELLSATDLQQLCKTMNFLWLSPCLTLYFWYNSRWSNPEIWPDSPCCTVTAPTYQDNRHPEYSRLGYLTGWYATVKSLNGTFYLSVGHLLILHYVYLYLEMGSTV